MIAATNSQPSPVLTWVISVTQRWFGAVAVMMAGLIYYWSGRLHKLTFEIIEKAYRLPDIIRWCRRLVRVLEGAKAIQIWDRLRVHRSTVVKALLAAHGI